MRSSLLLIVFLILAATSWSGNITPVQAAIVASNFYAERSNIFNHRPLGSVAVNKVRPLGLPTAYYVCEMQPSGFVVVSAIDLVLPVLAYSFDDTYLEDANLPSGFRTWMKHYENQILSIATTPFQPTTEVQQQWQHLLSEDFQPTSRSPQMQTVEPLLISKWNQDIHYNNHCPADPAGPGGHCYAGCVATAMGQLLYYYRFPQHGQGSYTYTHPVYGTLSADFGATSFDWDAMPSSISKDNDAIADLLYQLGVSVDMDYSPTGSGMWNHKAAYSLKTYFRFGPETQYYFRDSVTLDWDSLLVNNLNLRKPLYYAGWEGVQSTSGHAFVCDGYQPGNYYHFNWGWGGSQDGYFYTNNLTPSGYNFNFAQEVIPLFPDTLLNTYPPYCQGLKTLTSMRGSLEDGSGWYPYHNNSDCSWLIYPQDPQYDSIKSIKITFLRLDTEASGDTLYIYDGINTSAPLIGAFSGSTIPAVITSTGNKVLVKFHTNASIAKSGWQFDYESTFPVYCSGTTTLTSPSGSIEDGSGAKKYSNNSICHWKITPTGSSPLLIHFNSFETYDSTDFVKVYDLQSQEVLGVFTGNQIPPTLISQSGKMMILFMTNTTGVAQGWSADYHTSYVGINQLDSCQSEMTIYPNPTSGKITLHKDLLHPSTIEIIVYDITGNQVFFKKLESSVGSNLIMLNFESLNPASYYLVVDDGRQKDVKQLIIKK